VGVDFPALDQRIARFGEAVTALDLLLRQERTTFPGTFYRLENTPMYPLPVQHPRQPSSWGRCIQRYCSSSQHWRMAGTSW